MGLLKWWKNKTHRCTVDGCNKTQMAAVAEGDKVVQYHDVCHEHFNLQCARIWDDWKLHDKIW